MIFLNIRLRQSVMSILIRGRVVNYSFQGWVLKMSKSVNFVINTPESSGSSSSEDIVETLSKIKSLIPDLTPENHKGSCGRIGIIGGSSEYTGAPYFAGIAALKLGADLVHVFCSKEAALPIKSYTPELMVHPILDAPEIIKLIEPWLKKLHALVIGPGLGKNPVMLKNVAQIIMFCKSKQKHSIPLILDADALHLICESPEVIKGYKGALIFTPNGHEYNKLVEKVAVNTTYDLAAHFNAIIVKKGAGDVIQNGMMAKLFTCPPGETTMTCEVPGSFRRCGGQGDILAGFIGTFAAWNEITLKKQTFDFNSENDLRNLDKANQWKFYLKGFSYAAYGGCLMTRTCSNLGFKENGRNVTTSDMIKLIPKAYAICFGF